MVSNSPLDSSCLGLRQRSHHHLGLLECTQSDVSMDQSTSSMAITAFSDSCDIPTVAIDDRLAHQNAGRYGISGHIFTSSRHGVKSNGQSFQFAHYTKFSSAKMLSSRLQRARRRKDLVP